MRCDSCPVEAGLVCLGETTPALCRDVEAGMPGRAAQLVALAEGRPLPGSAAPTPGVARDVRLSLLRNQCPHGTKPEGTCGCNDTLACSRTGRETSRADCFACLEDDPPGAPRAT